MFRMMGAGEDVDVEGIGNGTTGDRKSGEGSGPDQKYIDDKRSDQLFTFEVLQITRDAQQQHGLRHGDYQRYRQYCARRLRRMRKAMHFPQGTRNRVQPKKIAGEILKDFRCLYLPLVDSERAWAYAMQLKSESNTELRKKYHMISRLRKAVQHSDVMETVCESGRYDARTKLEVQAYRGWMRGLLDLEKEDWKAAMENFSKSKTIYEKLADAVSEAARDIYLQRCEEIKPNIRYCAYNIGDESAVADLMQMRLNVSHEDPLTSRLDELIEKTREKQSKSLSEISWLGRTVPVKSEQIRVLLLSIQDNDKQLKVSTLSTVDQRMSLCESILKELIEAQQALRDEHKDDMVFKATVRGQQQSEGKTSDAVYLHTYLAYLRQTTTVERNLLMIEALKKARQQAQQQDDGAKKSRPQDFARLFDVIIQNLMEIAHLPGLEEQRSLVKDVSIQIVQYKAFRCFHTAETYASVKKWKEALALYERTVEYAKNALDEFKQSNSVDVVIKSKAKQDLEELISVVDGIKYSVRAASILDSQDLVDDLSTSSSTGNKPLSERLDEYCEDPSLTTKKSCLAQLPPDFQPIPAKPLFFDLALSLVEFPSLDDKVEQRSQAGGAGGIAGLVKGWFWGGSKK